MLEKLEQIRTTSLAALNEVKTDEPGAETALEELRIRHLGRKSPIMEIFSGLGALPPEERREVGRLGAGPPWQVVRIFDHGGHLRCMPGYGLDLASSAPGRGGTLARSCGDGKARAGGRGLVTGR